MAMLFTAAGLIDGKRVNQHFENERYRFYWSGFVFILGVPAGWESVQIFSEDLEKRGMREAVAELKGNYFMVIADKKTQTHYAFIDNGGGYDAYYSKRAVSKSFLDLVRFERPRKSQMNKETIVDFLNSGHIFFNRTFFDDIRRMDWNDLIKLDANGITMLGKQLSIIDKEKGNIELLDYFRQLSLSIQHHKLSVDLSGGVDSRLLTVLLDYFGLEFETTISGMDGIDDVEIPKEVSRVLGHPLYVTHPSIDDLEQDIEELFQIGDGLHDLFRQYRTVQHNRSRVERGMDLAITGIAGEFLKDNMWVQDFPFYVSKKSRIRRFILTRMHQFNCHDGYFAGEYKAINQEYIRQLTEKLGAMKLDMNTQTYDLIYYNYRMKTIASKYISSANEFLPCYAPFMELELFNHGFHLKRRERFFNLYHRKMMTSLRPEAAKVRTAENGISASLEKMELMKDLRKYAINRSIRLTKKIGQRLWNKTYFQQNPEHPQLYPTIRQMEITEKSVRKLKEEGILDPRIDLASIHNSHVGSIVTLGLIYELLEKLEQRVLADTGNGDLIQSKGGSGSAGDKGWSFSGRSRGVLMGE